MKFTSYNETNAPEDTKGILAAVKGKYGFVPNLMGVLAESKPVIESYIQLSDQVSNAGFDPIETQVMYLAANFENECDYCMAAHSTISKGMNMPEDVLNSLRAGTDISNPKLNALAVFTRSVVSKQGWVSEQDTQKFIDAGFTQKHILGVVLGVAHKTISNYINHINKTEVDSQFAGQIWKK